MLMNDERNRDAILSSLLFDANSRIDITPKAWDEFAASDEYRAQTAILPYHSVYPGVGQFGYAKEASQPLTLVRSAPEFSDEEPRAAAWNLTIETAPEGYEWCQLELMLDWDLCFKYKQFLLIINTKCAPPTPMEVHTYYEGLDGRQNRGSYSFSFITDELMSDIHSIDFGEIVDRKSSIDFNVPPRIMLSMPWKKHFRYFIGSCRLYSLK